MLLYFWYIKGDKDKIFNLKKIKLSDIKETSAAPILLILEYKKGFYKSPYVINVH